LSTSLRVALIGTNFGGAVQLPGFGLVEGVDVVAVVSARLERARAVAGQIGIAHAYDDYRRMFDEVDVDLVSIATPPYLHHEMVLEAARRGVHVLCEKPLALSAREAEEILSAVESNHLVHAVDFEFRYYRGLAAIKQAIDQDLLGQPRMARVIWRSDARATAEKMPYTWWSERDKGGGVLGAVASHWIDALRWWFGEPRDVSSQLNTYVSQRQDLSGIWRPVSTEDTAHLAMRLGALGVQGSIDVSMAVGPAGCRVEAYGTHAALVMDGYEDLLLVRPGAAPEAIPLAAPRFVAEAGQAVNVPAFAELVADVRDAIAGRPHHSFPDFRDGLAVQRVLDEAYRQAATPSGTVS
jgi:predicted dehydrogenase